MSTSNRVSHVIPQTVIDQVAEKLKECTIALEPYLTGLTEEERQDFLKWVIKR